VARQRSWLNRLVRAIVGLVLMCFAASILAVLMLRWINPPYTAFMAESQVAAWGGRGSKYIFRHSWVDLDRISPNLPLAVVASEDQKFPEHWGFDVEAIEKAYALNQHSHKVRGASTISQQWPKRRILEVYLNIAEFGYGTYGAEAAAQRFFHKPASRLTRDDAAVLAAVLPNPERLSAVAPSRFVQQRREWILGQMQALGGPEMLGEIDAYPGRSH
jgi:monofunctional biosynthetic peptidoglycan transglycosylase